MSEKLDRYIHIIMQKQSDPIRHLMRVLKWLVYSMVVFGIVGVGFLIRVIVQNETPDYELFVQALGVLKWVLVLLLIHRVIQIAGRWYLRWLDRKSQASANEFLSTLGRFIEGNSKS